MVVELVGSDFPALPLQEYGDFGEQQVSFRGLSRVVTACPVMQAYGIRLHHLCTFRVSTARRHSHEQP